MLEELYRPGNEVESCCVRQDGAGCPKIKLELTVAADGSPLTGECGLARAKSDDKAEGVAERSSRSIKWDINLSILRGALFCLLSPGGDTERTTELPGWM